MSTPRTRYPRLRRGMVPPATYGNQASTVSKTSNEDLQKTIRDLEEQVNKKAETKLTLPAQVPKGPEPKSALKNPALVVPKLEYPPIATLRPSGSESSSATLTEHQPSTTASTRRIPSWLIPQIRPPILRSPLVRPEEARPSDDYLVCIDRGEARVLKYNTVAEVRATFREPPELLPSGESRRQWLASEEMDKTGMCSQYGTCNACWKRVYPLDIHTPMHFDYVDEWMDHRWNCWNLLARMDMKLKWKPANGEEEFEDFC